MSPSAGDAQRWSQLRMMMTRQRDGTMLISLVHRQVDGRRSFDRRLDMAVVRLEPGDPASVDALEACRLAVEGLASRRWDAQGASSSGRSAPPPA